MGWDKNRISVHKFKVREKEIGSGQNCTIPAKVQENQCPGPSSDILPRPQSCHRLPVVQTHSCCM